MPKAHDIVPLLSLAIICLYFTRFYKKSGSFVFKVERLIKPNFKINNTLEEKGGRREKRGYLVKV